MDIFKLLKVQFSILCFDSAVYFLVGFRQKCAWLWSGKIMFCLKNPVLDAINMGGEVLRSRKMKTLFLETAGVFPKDIQWFHTCKC